MIALDNGAMDWKSVASKMVQIKRAPNLQITLNEPMLLLGSGRRGFNVNPMRNRFGFKNKTHTQYVSYGYNIWFEKFNPQPKLCFSRSLHQRWVAALEEGNGSCGEHDDCRGQQGVSELRSGVVMRPGGLVEWWRQCSKWRPQRLHQPEKFIGDGDKSGIYRGYFQKSDVKIGL